MLVAELSIFDIPILLYIKSMLLICTASFNITSLRAVRPIASSSVCYHESKRGFKIKYLKNPSESKENFALFDIKDSMESRRESIEFILRQFK